MHHWLAAACGIVLVACSSAGTAIPPKCTQSAKPAAAWPRIVSDVPREPKIEQRIAELLGRLTLEQKVAQMVQADIRFVTPQEVKTYRLGSILNGGGAWPGNNKQAKVSDWLALADQFYVASMDTSNGAPAIPIIWGVDAVHGHNNVIGATLFPHNIGLGGAVDHRAVARQAVRESLVLLKNKGALLPLNPKTNVLVAGDGANNIAKQSGGWTITWQGTQTTPADFPGATSIFEGIRKAVTEAGGAAMLSVDGRYQNKPDVAVVVFGENPYAEWHGDIRSLDYQGPEASSADLALLRRLIQEKIPVVAVFLTGRPLYVAPELDASDAFVVAWLPGSEGGGIADVLFRKASGEVNYNFTGKLSYSWPRTPAQTDLNRNNGKYDPLFAYGFGLTY